METALVPSVSLEAVVMKRNAVMERLAAAREAYSEACALAAALPEAVGRPDHHRVTYALQLYTADRRHFDESAQRRMETDVDGAIWAMLMDASGMLSLMDATAREAWRETVQKGRTPELTIENIEATFAMLHGQRAEFFERGVVEAFRRLSWDFKTNNPVRFGSRIILKRTFSCNAWTTFVEDYGADRLDDLVRVHCVLDGKPEPSRTHCARALLSKPMKDLRSGIELHGYLQVRGFRNGNAHVRFLRPELVERLNRIVAKHHPDALPPGRE